MPDLDLNRNLRALLIRHEGMRLKSYTDSVGKTTIGCGRNLTDVGISPLEANLLLKNDMDRVLLEAYQNFPWFKYLDSVRQDAILDMLFNLGMTRFSQFHQLTEALQNQNYLKAATEMLNSLWAQQVGVRARELSQMLLTGFYPRGLHED